MKAGTVRAALTAALAMATMAFAVAPAQGAHHLVSISEVYPEANGDPTAEFVELQNYGGSSNFYMGFNVDVVLYAANETVSDTVDLDANPIFGDSQRTVLLANAGANTELGALDEDFSLQDADLLSPTAGAVCFQSGSFSMIDCVSWGDFDLALPTDAAPAALGPIASGSSLERSKAPGCATLLEAGDDTNSSLADFAQQPSPTPRANSVTPTETACTPPPGGGGGGGGGATTTPVTTTPAPKKCKKGQKLVKGKCRKKRRKK